MWYVAWREQSRKTSFKPVLQTKEFQTYKDAVAFKKEREKDGTTQGRVHIREKGK